MNSFPVTYRRVAPGDAALIEDIYGSTRQEELTAVAWSDPQKRAFIRQQLALQTEDWAHNSSALARQIILVDGAAAGRLYVDRRERASTLHVVDISLLPAFRGLGIGSRVLRNLFAEADGRGWKTSLYVAQENPARHLYSRLGFAPVRQTGARLLMERAATQSASTPSFFTVAP